MLMTIARIAGSDTTSFTATCTMLLLVHNTSKLAALRKEIDAAFPSKKDPITFAKTQDLPYLNAVINESMRVMPVLSGGMERVVESTTTLSGYEIPPGTEVTCCTSNPHPI